MEIKILCVSLCIDFGASIASFLSTQIENHHKLGERKIPSFINDWSFCFCFIKLFYFLGEIYSHNTHHTTQSKKINRETNEREKIYISPKSINFSIFIFEFGRSDTSESRKKRLDQRDNTLPHDHIIYDLKTRKRERDRENEIENINQKKKKNGIEREREIKQIHLKMNCIANKTTLRNKEKRSKWLRNDVSHPACFCFDSFGSIMMKTSFT